MRWIPNLVTLSNLFAGCLAIVALLEYNILAVYWLFGYALVADLLDGALARLLDARSELGKQLDSLADLVSFGCFPAFLFFQMLLSPNTSSYFQLVAFPAFLLTVFTAIRLAKFNLDDSQAEVFIGLPSPANAILVFGIWSINQAFPLSPLLLYSLLLLSCGLLITPIHLLSLKFKNFSWRENKERYLLIIVSIAIFSLLGTFAPLFIILLYVVISLIVSYLKN